MSNVIYFGTDVKLNVHIEPINELTMDSYDFEVEVYCFASKSIKFKKSDAVKVDKDNYLITFNASDIGAGRIKCKVTAQIPDVDFKDKLRTEIVIVDTQLNIVK